MLLFGMAQSTSAQPLAGTEQQWGPNGNGTLNHEDDLQWLVFHGAKIAGDQAAGTYNATFGPFLQKMEGQHIAITGYILPLGATQTTTHFVLTRRSAGCPFCPPNEPTEAIEIFADRFVKTTPAPITVEGKLHLVAHSDQGLFFRIDGAKVW